MCKPLLLDAEVKDIRSLRDFKPLNVRSKKAGLHIIRTTKSWPSIDIHLSDGRNNVYTLKASTALVSARLMAKLDQDDQMIIRNLSNLPEPTKPQFNYQTANYREESYQPEIELA